MIYIWILFVAVLVVLILFSYQMKVMWKARKRLFYDCDPNPYFRITQDKLKSTDPRMKVYIIHQLDLTTMMLIKGDHLAAYNLLNSMDRTKLKSKTAQIGYFNNMLSVQCLLGYLDEAHQTKIRLSELLADYKFPIRKEYELIRISVRNSIASYEMMCGNLEFSKRTYREDLNSEYSNPYIRTMIHYCLGQIYEREQQLDQALEHYEASYPKAQHLYFYDDLTERISKIKMSTK